MLKTENDSIRSMKKHEIAAHVMALAPTITPRSAESLAAKWKRASIRRDLGFYEALRVSGIISDPTPRKAIKNIEGVAA